MQNPQPRDAAQVLSDMDLARSSVFDCPNPHTGYSVGAEEIEERLDDLQGELDWRAWVDEMAAERVTDLDCFLNETVAAVRQMREDVASYRGRGWEMPRSEFEADERDERKLVPFTDDETVDSLGREIDDD